MDSYLIRFLVNLNSLVCEMKFTNRAHFERSCIRIFAVFLTMEPPSNKSCVSLHNTDLTLPSISVNQTSTIRIYCAQVIKNRVDISYVQFIVHRLSTYVTPCNNIVVAQENSSI
jgi:hypothetical protein